MCQVLLARDSSCILHRGVRGSYVQPWTGNLVLGLPWWNPAPGCPHGPCPQTGTWRLSLLPSARGPWDWPCLSSLASGRWWRWRFCLIRSKDVSTGICLGLCTAPLEASDVPENVCSSLSQVHCHRRGSAWGKNTSPSGLDLCFCPYITASFGQAWCTA